LHLSVKPAFIANNIKTGAMRISALLYCLILLCLVVACAKPTVLPFQPSITTPTLNHDTITVRDGARLAMRHWLPETLPPKAVVVAAHGFNDYSHMYAGLGPYLAARGIATYAYDHRGYGHSPGFGIWPGKENLIRDMADVAASIRAAYPDIPLYVMGESMGGAVTLLAAEEGALPRDIAGIILSAPAVWGDKTMGWLYRLPLWIAVHTFPSFRVGGKNLGIYPSDNMEMLRELSRDPRVIKKSRFDTLYGVVSLMDDAYREANTAGGIPVLFLYGAHDQIIPKIPTVQIMERLRHHRIAYYPDGYHMLTRDLQAAVVMQDIAAWIAAPDAPLPSGWDREVGSRLQTDMGK
jgi:acylglycerol lipase